MANAAKKFARYVRIVSLIALLPCAVSQAVATTTTVPGQATPTLRSNAASTAAAVDAPITQTLQFSDAGAILESDQFDVDINQTALAGSVDRAWEYRPYRVAVWLCVDGSPQLSSVAPSLKSELADLTELVDPSGWNVVVDAAPRRWRWQFLSHIANPDCCGGFQEEPVLQDYDKLIVVALTCPNGRTHANVREHDLVTGQWGALISQQLGQRQGIAAAIVRMIRGAFMPLAQIDRVTEKEGARLIPRGLKACLRSRPVMIDGGTGGGSAFRIETKLNKKSPVFIGDEDRFLPVIRRTDRKGKVIKLEPIEFTFLSVKEVTPEAIKCEIHSSQRAPLAQRKSKRAQKLALVIRAPEQPTKLTLVSKDDTSEPMPAVEIWSRRPGMTKDEKSEYIGKTDWLGSIEIPPSEDQSLRLIFLKRGSRALKKLPIIPGLYPKVTATVPNDKVRLFAQGIITGFGNDITALVIQRRNYEAQIEAAIKKNDLDTAKQILRTYTELESPQDIRSRMTDAKVRLDNMTNDKRELDHIRKMFANLYEVVGDEIKKSRESELQSRVQQISARN